jgi:hypothetical protein
VSQSLSIFSLLVKLYTESIRVLSSSYQPDAFQSCFILTIVTLLFAAWLIAGHALHTRFSCRLCFALYNTQHVQFSRDRGHATSTPSTKAYGRIRPFVTTQMISASTSRDIRGDGLFLYNGWPDHVNLKTTLYGCCKCCQLHERRIDHKYPDRFYSHDRAISDHHSVHSSRRFELRKTNQIAACNAIPVAGYLKDAETLSMPRW